MTSIVSNSLEETKKIAKEWLNSLSGSNVVGLSGDLGSGKTTFTQAVAQALGVSEFVTSPTFVIMKSYQVKDKVFKKLIHIDAYRFEQPEELEVLDFNNLASDKQNLILIEWPERIKSALPSDMKTITFEVAGENQRKISFV